MVRRTACLVLSSAFIALVAACVSDEDPQASVPPSCDSYCTEVMQRCGGANLQYRDESECRRACQHMDPGTLADANVSSIGCRLSQLRSGNCLAAGPFGGGVCGARCATFCRMIGAACVGIASPPFGGSEGTCNEACPSFALDPAEGEGPNQAAFPGKNSINCREHHLILALKDPVPHCGHADIVSVMCR